MRREVLRLCHKRRWSADHIAYETGLAASTVQNTLRSAGLGRLDVGDRASDREPVLRCRRDCPGELVRVDANNALGYPRR